MCKTKQNKIKEPLEPPPLPSHTHTPPLCQYKNHTYLIIEKAYIYEGCILKN